MSGLTVTVSGTTLNKDGTTALSYPEGFTIYNSRIVCGGIQAGGAWYEHDPRIQVLRTSANLQISTDTEAFFNKPCYITLIKV